MSKKKEENLGTVTKNRAIKIFEALGFKTAGKWDVTRLQKKLSNLDILVEGAELDEKNQKKVNEILQAQKNGLKVIVIDVENAERDRQQEQEIRDAQERGRERAAEEKARAAKKEEKDAAKKVVESVAVEKQEESIVNGGKKNRSGIKKAAMDILQEKPVLEKDVVVKLVKKFPDLQEKTIKSTVGWLLWNLKKSKGVRRNEDKKYELI